MVVVCQTQRRQGHLHMLKWSRKGGGGNPGGARSRHFTSSPAARRHVSVTHRMSVPLERMYSSTADRFTHGPTDCALNNATDKSVECTVSKRVIGTRIRFLKLTILFTLLDLPTKSPTTTTLIFRCDHHHTYLSLLSASSTMLAYTGGRWYPIPTPLMALTTSRCSGDGDTASS